MKIQKLVFFFVVSILLSSFPSYAQENTDPDTALKKNPIAQALKENSLQNFEEADALYRKEANKGENTSYNEALKQLGFVLVMKNGLLEEGSLEQKKFYLEEQLKLGSNLMVLDTFYDLLADLQNSMDKKEVAEISENFTKKNIAEFKEIGFYKKAEKKRLEEIRVRNKEIQKRAKRNI